MNVEGMKLKRTAILATLAAIFGGSLGACAEQPTPEALPGPRDTGEVDLVGMYRYMADAAVFEDCDSGKRYPVLIEGAHLDIERAYLKLSDGAGAPVLLAARFEIVERAPEPGMPMREHLRVIEFDRFQPGEACQP